MKKLLLLFLLVISTFFTGYAQFTILNPGVTIHSIRDLKEADTNNIIFATDNGVLVYNGSSWQHIDTTKGLSALDIRAIGPVADTLFFYSVGNKGLGLCDYIKASDAALPVSASYDYVSAIYYSSSSGQTLLGSDNGNVWLIYASTVYPLPFDSVYKITLGSVTDIGQLSGAVDFYVITTTNQIILYQFSSGTTVLINSATSPLPSNNVLSNAIYKSISYDGTDKGIYVADFTSFPTVSTKLINTGNSPIPSDTISAIAVVDSNLFIGTPLGLAVRINGEWKIYNSSNSNLPSSDIAKLAADAKNLWIGTGDGQICKIGMSEFTTDVATVNKTDNQIICYPNPSTGIIHVQTKATVNENLITIYNMAGEKMQSEKLPQDGNINAGNLPPGQYLLVLTNDMQTSRTRITIVK